MFWMLVASRTSPLLPFLFSGYYVSLLSYKNLQIYCNSDKLLAFNLQGRFMQTCYSQLLGFSQSFWGRVSGSPSCLCNPSLSTPHGYVPITLDNRLLLPLFSGCSSACQYMSQCPAAALLIRSYVCFLSLYLLI